MSSKCIVVVDDNRIMVDFMTRLLTTQGHRVLSARDGIEALALLAHETPDIIFLDMIMPRISGDALVPIIRKMSHLNQTKIVVISAAATEMQQRGSLDGVDACLAKRPFNEMSQQVTQTIHALDAEDPAELPSDVPGAPRRITLELLTQSSHFQSILEGIGEGILELDGNRIVFANAAACRLLGAPIETVLGRRIVGLFEETLQPDIEQLVANTQSEVQLRRHDRHLALSRMPQHNGQGATLLLLRDITAERQRETGLRQDHDRMEAMVKERTAELADTNRSLTAEVHRRRTTEASLRASKDRFDRFMTHLSAAAFMKDDQGRYVYANPACGLMFGQPVESMMGRSDHELWPPETAELLEIADRQIRAGGGEVTQDVRFPSESGERQMLVSVFGVPTDEAMMYVAGFAVDVSERNAAEAEQQKLTEQLQRARKMEAIGVLAGAVAHDLNNTLSGLVSYPELLLMDVSEDSPMRKPLETIKASGDQAAATVQDLLTLARRNIATCEPVGINALVADYLGGNPHRELVQRHGGVTVECRLDSDALPILGSQLLLVKIIAHVVAHAAAGIRESGTITITTANRYIDQPLTGYDTVAEGDYVLLSIVDTGEPIPEEHLDRIFEPLFTKRVLKRTSTGLGLAMVWGAVKDHGGMIDVKSTPGEGNRFTIYFPASRSDVDTPSRPQSVAGRNESILVVDDVSEQRAIASNMLTRLGYRVVAVSSGEAAVEYLKQETADLVVLDMIMDPGIDGTETFRRIREFQPDQRAIIASGYTETDRVRLALELGADTYLKKPYLIDTLGVAVRNALDASQA